MHGQTLIQDGEDKLWCSIYNSHNIGKMYNLKISTKKTKVMAFKGKFLVRTKIITHNILQKIYIISVI
jgi:hypothetical protein